MTTAVFRGANLVASRNTNSWLDGMSRFRRGWKERGIVVFPEDAEGGGVATPGFLALFQRAGKTFKTKPGRLELRIHYYQKI